MSGAGAGAEGGGGSASIRPGCGAERPRRRAGMPRGPRRSRRGGDGGARVRDGAAAPRPTAPGGGEGRREGGRAGEGPGRAGLGRGLEGSRGRGSRRSPRPGRREERCAGPGAGGPAGRRRRAWRRRRAARAPGCGLCSEPTLCLVCAFLSLFLSPRLGFAHSMATRTVRSAATSPRSARRRNVPHGVRTGTRSWLPLCSSGPAPCS